MVGLGGQSPFVRAFYDYLQHLPAKKNQRSMLSRIDTDDPPTPERIQEAMCQMESKHGQKTSIKLMRKLLEPAVAVMKDYYGVFDTLCQADPTPGIVLWGILKIVVDGLGRFLDLFDRIKGEVLAMTTHLRRLTFYEELYGRSPDMQEYLFSSYKDVFRFWCRVDKECNRCSLNSLLRASTSFSLKKLQRIMDDLRQDADQIEKLVPIVEGQYASHERLQASVERQETRKDRDEGSIWRKQVQSDRVRSWLGSQMINASNLRRHQDNLIAAKNGGPCSWLLSDPKFQAWVDGTASKSVLWLFGGPGTGKSVSCSHAIDHIQTVGNAAAVAAHFYEFDDQRSALLTAQMLATQLFERYWLMYKDIPQDLLDASQRSDANLVNILEFIRLLVLNLPTVYIFLDGLDEECPSNRWSEAVKILNFVTLLATTFPKRVRLWYSSQDRFVVRKELGSFPTLDIKESIKGAVDEFISSTVPGIDHDEVDHKTRDWILGELKRRADGNFLWASLMIKSIENEVTSFDEMELFIKRGLPEDLDAYYGRIFAQYRLRERDLASKIFTLITFARRRLRMKELREAIGMISSERGSLEARNIPWRQAIEKLLSPLIETHPDPDDPEQCFCHLFHSTVKSFLQSNPSILCQDQSGGVVISEATLGDACLLYLSQDRYAQLLKGNANTWKTSTGEDVKEHHFLTYSAKYWHKHLNEVGESPALRQGIEKFIVSTNFQTTLQIQSLFIEGQFNVYAIRGCLLLHKYTKIVFPEWFTSPTSSSGSKFLKDYRSFISEWNDFLHCATCGSTSCHAESYRGELDRCLWNALGPQNFLSSNCGRYTSFSLTSEDGSRHEETVYHEGIAMDAGEVLLLQLSNQRPYSSTGQEADTFPYESWSLVDRSAPILNTSATINTTLDTTKWQISKSISDKKDRLGYPEVVSFTPDLSFVRIGNHMFSKGSSGEYCEDESLKAILNTSSFCVEDITSRGRYLVMTSRRKLPADTQNRGRKDDRRSSKDMSSTRQGSTLGNALNNTGCQHCSREPSVSDERSKTPEREHGEGKVDSDDDYDNSDYDGGDDSTSYSSPKESEAWTSLEESWSEGSTEDDQTTKVPWGMQSSEEDITSDTQSEEDSEFSDVDDAPVVKVGQLKEESDSDEGDIDFDCGSDDDAYEGDSDLSDSGTANSSIGFDSDDEDMPTRRAYVSRRPKPDFDAEHGLLRVFNLDSSQSVQVFRFCHPLPIMLYHSPPVLHPTKTLVVWPLCGGEVLFGDIEGKTYFMRKARPSTRKTRHISMKCHFSACGRFLHIVSLEAQQQPLTKAESKAKAKTSLLISAFCSTHRLSSRKTSRSPPTLIHRAKVSLGSTEALCPSRLPVEVTWSDKEVYLSSSSDSNQLVLFRVDLFPRVNMDDSDASVVSVPRQIILLPKSARSRSVHYFPPRSQDSHGLVFIGSWTSKPKAEAPSNDVDNNQYDVVQGLPYTTSPPIGFYVNEDTDLGGWGPSNAVAEISAESDKGQLKQKMEPFVGEDDCNDLEHYFFA